MFVLPTTIKFGSITYYTVIDFVLINSPLAIYYRSLRTEQQRAILQAVDSHMYQTDIDQTDLHRS